MPSAGALERLPAASVVFPDRPVAASPYLLGIVPGEGIGPEVTEAALRVLDALQETGPARFDLRFVAPSPATGGVTPEEETFFAEIFAAGGAVLCGPRGGRFVYELRRLFDLYLKLSPLRVSPALARLSHLKADFVAGTDVMVVRDNAGGVYQGEWSEEREAAGRVAIHRFADREPDVRRVIEAAAAVAAQRTGRMSIVGKDGGTPSISRLWREVTSEVAAARGISWEMVNVDFAAYRLVQEPRSFDVLVCPNLEGDILADVGAVLLGSRGISFSGNFTPSGLGVYQTNHGAAADLAGRDVANPLGHLNALAMLLRESLGLVREAEAVERAIESVLTSGARTADLAGHAGRVVGTREMTDLVVEALRAR